MGVRQKLNDNPVLAIVLAVIFIVAAIPLAIFGWRYFVHPLDHPRVFPAHAYFTEDDGKTTFLGNNDLIPPFDHNGKQAVRAVMYACPNGQPFVHHLEKYDDESRARIEEQIAKGVPSPEAQSVYAAGGLMIKRAGDPTWVQLKKDDGEARKAWFTIMHESKCPDGTMRAHPVNPDAAAAGQ